MKTRLFLLLMLFICITGLLSFKIVSKPRTVIQSNGLTLNGYDYTTAQNEIATYESHYTTDQGAKSFSVWFKKDEIQSMLNVLKTNMGRVDGVRFYFGATSVNLNKLKLVLFLIATKQKSPLPPPHKGISSHGDFPLEETTPTGILGAIFQDRARDAFQAGGLLYGDGTPAMSGTCANSSLHRMAGTRSYNWVQRRDEQPVPAGHPLRKRDTSGYNTESEWFDICFITSLFTTIANSPTQFDGLRVYLGEGLRFKNNPFKKRDVFILVPTSPDSNNPNMHDDNFACLNLPQTSFCTMGNPHPLHPSRPGKKALAEAFNRRYFKYSRYFMDGGYDKGELCPTVCN